MRQDAIAAMVMHRLAEHDLTPGPVLMELLRMQRYGVELTQEIVARVLDAAVERQLRERELAALKPDPKHPDLVYYMRTGNRCKIGTSTNLLQRLATLNPEELLVTEPGDRRRELERHKQFAHLRTHGEWFRYEDDLVAHVTALQAAQDAT